MIKRIILLSILLSPVVAWALYKPMRVLSPELNGITCINKEICIEEKEKTNKATSLYNNALSYVNSSVGQIKKNPRVTFCSSELCYQSFGFRAPAKATTVGISGIVISPRGWNMHFMRHEMIHHLQSERLGVVQQYLKPEWFKEGMAYSLSQEPRKLTEPWNTYQIKFESWLANINNKSFWEEAEKL